MKIAIAGYGVEGEANYNYWAAQPGADITIVDESDAPKHSLPVGVNTILGAGAFERLNGFDLVVRTAGLAPSKIKTDGKIWSATNEFFVQSPALIIGVTGTKGKGTTSSMISSILEAAGKKVWLVGNIGTAALQTIDQITANDIVVYEMSSFQLWDIEHSPHVAVVLPIEPDHLNVHTDMEDYVTAKGGIRRYQHVDDICIYHASNDYARLIALSNQAAPMIRYGIETDGGVYVKNGNFCIREHIICSIDVMQVPGQHNIDNACAAMSVVQQLGLQQAIVDGAITTGMRNFKALPHRIELVRNLDGVEYYNDSFSSAPSASIAAIQSFTQPEIVIVGGVDKGADFGELAEAIKTSPYVKEIVLIGQIRDKLHGILKDAGITAPLTLLDAQTMPQIVGYVHGRVNAGDVVLFSPGCASFDMFKDFYDRGNQFRSIVMAL